VGVGAVCLVKFLRRALLAFGMVHPQWHRRGVGTALLLARAAALPEPSPRWTLVLSTLSGSRSFYERFGFTKYGQHRDKIRGSGFDDHYAHLNRDAWTECHVQRHILALLQRPYLISTNEYQEQWPLIARPTRSLRSSAPCGILFTVGPAARTLGGLTMPIM